MVKKDGKKFSWLCGNGVTGRLSMIQRRGEISAQCQNKHLSLPFNALCRRKKVQCRSDCKSGSASLTLSTSAAAHAPDAFARQDVGNLFRHMFSYIIKFTAIKSSSSTCETKEKICSPNNTHSLSMDELQLLA